MDKALLVAAMACLLAADGNSWGAWTAEGKPEFVIKRASEKPALSGLWDSPVWQSANELRIDNFYSPPDRKVSDEFQPDARCRVLYDDAGVYIHFRVKDRYVRTVATEYHGKVWEDACVEFFVQPKPERGYFNFEINSGGTMLLSYHENPEWKGDVLLKDGGVPWELARNVQIYHSLPKVMDPETTDDVTWQNEYFIPREVFEAYLGPLGDLSGQTWRANFYKCAENNSHPHWASWSKITGKLDFHQPEFFGIIRFE